MNIVKIGVDNVDDLLAAFGAGAKLHVQSAAASAGPWADIAAPTQVLVSGTTLYTFSDAAGGSGTWYQSRYESSNGSVTGDWSQAFQVSTFGYCTLDDVKARLNLTSTQVTYDEYLSAAIGWVSDRIDQTVGFQFYPNPASGSADFLFDAWTPAGDDGGQSGGMITDNGRCLLIPRGIVSLTALQVATYTGGTYTTIPTTDWFLRPTAQERQPGYPFTELWITNIPAPADTTPAFFPGYATVKLQGAVLGWPAIPLSISDICQTIVVASYRARGAGGGDSFTVAEDGTRTFERMWSATDLRALGRFRLKLPYFV